MQRRSYQVRKHKTERAAQAEIDFSNLLSNLYCTVFGLLAAGCARKCCTTFAVDRWLAHARNKVSEWLKKRSERRKVSTEGQTYDLPRMVTWDAAVMHMLQNKDNDPYSVLGVPRDATDDDIRKQYRKLAVLIHPDKNTHPQADEAFKTLANAFDILSDPEKRANYDAEAAWKRQAEEREEQFGRAGSPEQFLLI
ncbi:Cleavage inducing molecular chaperone [Desmophyllum pertusum]|uniref:Cleavage inducing molecular chaperone n=1 Tax=Desmophyllum pertusum TaxID=174260 RepID=A0A9X0CDX0_9CNID|nr:Cleavage inducing molecular chaperone [Desmophyllum pertusum]